MSITAYIRDIFNNPEKYAKFWVAAIGFAVSMLTVHVPEASWLPPLIQALTAAGVFAVPNKKVNK